MKPLIIVFSLCALSCQSTGHKEAEASDDGTEGVVGDSLSLPSDFIAFYQQFHDDSAYQIAHIIFPLAGLPANSDTLKINSGKFKWQLADWKIHRPFDSSLAGYTKTFSKFEDGIIIETITQNQVGVGMERRFAKMDTAWMLIYYAGMNYLK